MPEPTCPDVDKLERIYSALLNRQRFILALDSFLNAGKLLLEASQDAWPLVPAWAQAAVLSLPENFKQLERLADELVSIEGGRASA